jgi:hypothetical protein
VIEDWNEVPSVIKKMPGLSTPSKEPIEIIGWKRWDSPRKNLIPDPEATTTTGAGHLFRGPTWAAGGQLTSIPT